MTTRIFTGHVLADQLHQRTRALVAELGRAPRFTVLLDEANIPMRAYAQRQQEAAGAVGIDLTFVNYETMADGFQAQLQRLGADPAIDAVMTLYPLPNEANAVTAALLLGAGKDVDGLHPYNAGLLALGAPARAPATARACLLALEHLAGPLNGVEVAIVGASRIVGRPLGALLLDAGATISICHDATRDLRAHTAAADVVVTAAGVPGLIDAAHIRQGAILVDVSIVRTADGLVGDVDLASVDGKAAIVTHVPDGIGPITTACLFENIALAALAR